MTESHPRSGASRPSSGRTKCTLCSKKFPERQVVAARALRVSLSDHITTRHPDLWREDSRVCKTCLAQERFEFLMQRLVLERGELSSVEQEIAHKASHHEALAADITQQFDTRATRGQRIADRVAAVGGSWPFVITFLAALVVWAVVNSLALGAEAFDPYPYILLNLFLSCLAALQAPIIMMSQNRVSARDRMQADEDFRINLKAELEVASLHEKVDHLLHSQWQHMVELQEMQLDLLNELANRKS